MRQTQSSIDGRHYQVSRQTGQARRDLAPGERPPRNASYTAPHPNPELRRLGWRVAVIFLGAAWLFGCLWWYLQSLVTGGLQ